MVTHTTISCKSLQRFRRILERAWSVNVRCTKISSISKLVIQTGGNLALELVKLHYYIWSTLFFEEMNIVGNLIGFHFEMVLCFKLFRSILIGLKII